MSTKKKTEVAVTGNVSLQQIAELSAGVNPSNPEELKNLMQMAKQVPQNELVMVAGAPYLEFEPEETVMVIYTGIIKGAMKSLKEGATDADVTDAVGLINEDGLETINADVVMLSTARKLDAMGFVPPYLLRVYCAGMKGTKGREYKDLQIFRYAGKPS